MTITSREDTNPEHTLFYVSAIDGPRTFLIAGPYDSHHAALSRVDAVRDHARSIDGRAHFMAWGTCSSASLDKSTPLGRF